MQTSLFDAHDDMPFVFHAPGDGPQCEMCCYIGRNYGRTCCTAGDYMPRRCLEQTVAQSILDVNAIVGKKQTREEIIERAIRNIEMCKKVTA